MKSTEETVKPTEVRGKIGSMSEQTITEFLEARIAEDEAVVSIRGNGSHSIHSFDIVGAYNPNCPDCRGLAGNARVLAECAAKRGVLEMTGNCDAYTREAIARLMSAPYAGHADYQPEWAL